MNLKEKTTLSERRQSMQEIQPQANRFVETDLRTAVDSGSMEIGVCVQENFLVW